MCACTKRLVSCNCGQFDPALSLGRVLIDHFLKSKFIIWKMDIQIQSFIYLKTKVTKIKSEGYFRCIIKILLADTTVQTLLEICLGCFINFVHSVEINKMKHSIAERRLSHCHSYD